MKTIFKLLVLCITLFLSPSSLAEVDELSKAKAQQIVTIMQTHKVNQIFLDTQEGMVGVARIRGKGLVCKNTYIRFIHSVMVDDQPVIFVFDHCKNQSGYSSYSLINSDLQLVLNKSAKKKYLQVVKELYRQLAPRA
jgi:hypothetical protein